MRCQTYGYLPGHRTSLPFGRYQIVLLGDRGTWVLATCPKLLPDSAPAGSWTVAPQSQVLHANHYTTKPHCIEDVITSQWTGSDFFYQVNVTSFTKKLHIRHISFQVFWRLSLSSWSVHTSMTQSAGRKKTTWSTVELPEICIYGAQNLKMNATLFCKKHQICTNLTATTDQS